MYRIEQHILLEGLTTAFQRPPSTITDQSITIDINNNTTTNTTTNINNNNIEIIELFYKSCSMSLSLENYINGSIYNDMHNNIYNNMNTSNNHLEPITYTSLSICDTNDIYCMRGWNLLTDAGITCGQTIYLLPHTTMKYSIGKLYIYIYTIIITMDMK